MIRRAMTQNAPCATALPLLAWLRTHAAVLTEGEGAALGRKARTDDMPGRVIRVYERRDEEFDNRALQKQCQTNLICERHAKP